MTEQATVTPAPTEPTTLLDASAKPESGASADTSLLVTNRQVFPQGE